MIEKDTRDSFFYNTRRASFFYNREIMSEDLTTNKACIDKVIFRANDGDSCFM